MGIRYYKLFDLLERRGMKRSDLREILSSATIAKLGKGEHISGEAIEKICIFLECQPGDIMEYVEEHHHEQYGKIEVAEHTKQPTDELIEYNEYKNGIPIETLKAREFIKNNKQKKPYGDN